MADVSTSGNAIKEPSNSAFQTLHLAQVQGDLLTLYQRIACESGRVHIINPGKSDGSCDCVLISKAELDSIEHALEILANSDHVKALRASLGSFVDQLHGNDTSNNAEAVGA